MSTKKYKALMAKVDELQAEYHEASQQDMQSQKHLNALSAKIKQARQAASDYVVQGAKAGKDAELVGLRKKAGLWEILDLTSGNRARGEDREEVVENWNAGEFYTPDPEASPIGKAEDLEAAEAAEDLAD